MDVLYDRIADLCSKKGISITTMCRDSDVSRAAISDLRMGRSKTLSSATLSKIATYFGVSLDCLLGNDNNEEKPAATEDDELNEYLEELKTRPEMRMLFSLAKGATKQDVEQAVAIVEALFKARGGEQ